MEKTRSVNPKEALEDRKWLLVDAKDMILGRIAADIAAILRGKHKPTYTPHVDCGDYVVVINAADIKLTAGKTQTKMRYRHSGYPGGLTEEPYGRLMEKDPGRALRMTVRGMLPHNNLGRMMIRKLKVYAGSEHPHLAQNPETVRLPHERQQEEVKD